jgi:hypothetical protein
LVFLLEKELDRNSGWPFRRKFFEERDPQGGRAGRSARSARRAKIAVMEFSVWVAGWQMECCGKHFRVGSQVTWKLVFERSQVFPGFVADAHEDHHEMGQEINEVTGTVLAIEAVSADYALEEPDCEMFASVDGSARGMPIRGTDLWDREPETWHPENGGRKFAGYLVRLETATVLGT